MSTTSIPAPNPSSAAWNLYLNNQSCQVTGLDGAPTNISFLKINALMYELSVENTCAGFSLGFSSLLLIILLLTMPVSKLRKPIFLLNLISLFLVAFNDLLVILVNSSLVPNVGLQLLDASNPFPNSDETTNIMHILVALLLYPTTLTSLVMQVRVVFTAEILTRTILTIIGAIGVIFQTGITFSWVVYNIRASLNWSDSLPMWMYTVLRAFYTFFVGVASLIFLGKLGFTIYRRRKMNIRQFGPMEIIFVMFCQCLVVPGISPVSKT